MGAIYETAVTYPHGKKQSLHLTNHAVYVYLFTLSCKHTPTTFRSNPRYNAGGPGRVAKLQGPKLSQASDRVSSGPPARPPPHKLESGAERHA